MSKQNCIDLSTVDARNTERTNFEQALGDNESPKCLLKFTCTKADFKNIKPANAAIYTVYAVYAVYGKLRNAVDKAREAGCDSNFNRAWDLEVAAITDTSRQCNDSKKEMTTARTNIDKACKDVKYGSLSSCIKKSAQCAAIVNSDEGRLFFNPRTLNLEDIDEETWMDHSQKCPALLAGSAKDWLDRFNDAEKEAKDAEKDLLDYNDDQLEAQKKNQKLINDLDKQMKDLEQTEKRLMTEFEDKKAEGANKVARKIQETQLAIKNFNRDLISIKSEWRNAQLIYSQQIRKANDECTFSADAKFEREVMAKIKALQATNAYNVGSVNRLSSNESALRSLKKVFRNTCKQESAYFSLINNARDLLAAKQQEVIDREKDLREDQAQAKRNISLLLQEEKDGMSSLQRNTLQAMETIQEQKNLLAKQRFEAMGRMQQSNTNLMNRGMTLQKNFTTAKNREKNYGKALEIAQAGNVEPNDKMDPDFNVADEVGTLVSSYCSAVDNCKITASVTAPPALAEIETIFDKEDISTSKSFQAHVQQAKECKIREEKNSAERAVASK